MKRARSLGDAVRRLHALIDVLDEDLRIAKPLISVPEQIRRPEGKEAVEARAALRFLAHSVDEMERDVAEARQSADGWRRRSSAAWERGEYHLAAQARRRVLEAEQDLQLYEEEIAAARQLLQRCSDAQIDWTKQ